jgi:hypothetical protein
MIRGCESGSVDLRIGPATVPHQHGVRPRLANVDGGTRGGAVRGARVGVEVGAAAREEVVG